MNYPAPDKDALSRELILQKMTKSLKASTLVQISDFESTMIIKPDWPERANWIEAIRIERLRRKATGDIK